MEILFETFSNFIMKLIMIIIYNSNYYYFKLPIFVYLSNYHKTFAQDLNALES